MDRDRVNKHSWYLYTDKNGYQSIRSDSSKGLNSLARFIVSPLPYELVDHINGNIFDNTRTNLRIVDRSQNAQNKKKQKSSNNKYKGVYTYRNRYRAIITIRGDRIDLGYFDTPELAALEYDKFARKLFGEYGRYNFPLVGERQA